MIQPLGTRLIRGETARCTRAASEDTVRPLPCLTNPPEVRAGLEPATSGLQIRRSTIELPHPKQVIRPESNRVSLSAWCKSFRVGRPRRACTTPCCRVNHSKPKTPTPPRERFVVRRLLPTSSRAGPPAPDVSATAGSRIRMIPFRCRPYPWTPARSVAKCRLSGCHTTKAGVAHDSPRGTVRLPVRSSRQAGPRLSESSPRE